MGLETWSPPKPPPHSLQGQRSHTTTGRSQFTGSIEGLRCSQRWRRGGGGGDFVCVRRLTVRYECTVAGHRGTTTLLPPWKRPERELSSGAQRTRRAGRWTLTMIGKLYMKSATCGAQIATWVATAQRTLRRMRAKGYRTDRRCLRGPGPTGQVWEVEVCCWGGGCILCRCVFRQGRGQPFWQWFRKLRGHTQKAGGNQKGRWAAGL